jgi:hypothetical protein
MCPLSSPALSARCLLDVEGARANASEYAFSTYGLAGNAFPAKAIRYASSSTLLLAVSKMSQFTRAASCSLVARPFTMRYIASALPILQPAPPRGEQWLQEFKFGNWDSRSDTSSASKP